MISITWGKRNYDESKKLRHQQLSELEKNINEFLKKEIKQLIDIKFTVFSKDGVDKFAALIIYQEDMSLGKEDPQMYE